MSTVIRVENVSKQYRLGEVGTGTLSHDLNRWWYKVRGKEDPYLKIGETNDRSTKADSDYSWALRDVSFEVKQGEVLGIIGRNGAGKSTLLKILSRVTTPTTGQIQVKGRIASLLEVGTGFHPELTGRENIFLNGAILGMRKAEIASKFDEIVDFSGCERYVDTPVKRYSSGMYVRLAFAVAAHLEPEILIVDEVLAVGDAEFQKKCLGKMKDVAGQGRTVLFVSHNMTSVAALCDAAILLESGCVSKRGEALEVLDEYSKRSRDIAKSSARTWEGPLGDDTAQVLRARIAGNQDGPFTSELPIAIEVEFKLLKPVYGLIVAWKISNERKEKLVYSCADDSKSPPGAWTQPGFYKMAMEIPANTFAFGYYEISLDLGIHNTRTLIPVDSVILALPIENVVGIGRRYPAWSNLIRPAWKWVVADSLAHSNK